MESKEIDEPFLRTKKIEVFQLFLAERGDNLGRFREQRAFLKGLAVI